MIFRFLAALGVLALPARAATVVANVTGIPDGRGHVWITLCTKAEFLKPSCPWKTRIPAKSGTVRASIPGVPPGLYAAQAFHDANDNGKLDRDFLGRPEEAMGFSNNAPMHFGPPDFAAASFTVGDTDMEISFALRSYH